MLYLFIIAFWLHHLLRSLSTYLFDWLSFALVNSAHVFYMCVCVCAWLVPLLHTIFIHLDTSITYYPRAPWKMNTVFFSFLNFFLLWLPLPLPHRRCIHLFCFRYSIMRKKWSNSYLLSNIILRAFYAFETNAVLIFLYFSSVFLQIRIVHTYLLPQFCFNIYVYNL